MIKNNNKRKISDGILNSLTYLSSGIALAVLVALFIFIFSKGAHLVNFDLLTNDYWSTNAIVAPSIQESNTIYERPSDLASEVVWSEKWGIGFVDAVSAEKEQLILVEYVAEDSPLATTVNTSAGPTQGDIYPLSAGLEAHKIDYILSDGTTAYTGMMRKETAEIVVANLDNAATITSLFVKTAGGGIRGSLITTGYLILLSLLIALPIGIASAIYLNEVAKKNKINAYIRSGIEILTGVPSIVFGLMGVSVLFPITAMFGATTTNILLGAMTLSIILLPTIIRSTEEALIVVPKSLRDASLSLGASEVQTIFKVTLPCAIPGILTGVLLSIGRIIGESAALIYTMGTFVNDSPTLLSQGTSLAVQIWSVMAGEQPNFELASAISIFILIFVLILNVTIKLISKKLSKAWY